MSSRRVWMATDDRSKNVHEDLDELIDGGAGYGNFGDQLDQDNEDQYDNEDKGRPSQANAQANKKKRKKNKKKKKKAAEGEGSNNLMSGERDNIQLPHTPLKYKLGASL